MPDIIIDFDWKAIDKMEADFDKPVFIDFDWNEIIKVEIPFEFNLDFIFDNGAGNDSNYQ